MFRFRFLSKNTIDEKYAHWDFYRDEQLRAYARETRVERHPSFISFISQFRYHDEIPVISVKLLGYSGIVDVTIDIDNQDIWIDEFVSWDGPVEVQYIYFLRPAV